VITQGKPGKLQNEKLKKLALLAGASLGWIKLCNTLATMETT